jgi:hypothetical protein
MIYIYILSILFIFFLKIYDDLSDFYNINHGTALTESIKLIITILVTLIIVYSNNVYVYSSILTALSFAIFSTDAYFDNVYFGCFTIIFGIILLILIKLFFVKINFKELIIIGIFISINGFPLLLQEKIIIPFQNISFFSFIQKIVNKIQIKDEEIGYNKLKIRVLGIITCILQLLFINGYVSNYFKLSTNAYFSITTNCLVYLTYYLTSVIHQTYVLYKNI